MTILTYILAFLGAIGILVAVHEYGHFWMARRMGIRVMRFSIGFGQRLWSRTDRRGTEFAISAIPLGGYVKLLDEREGPVAEAQLSEAYNRKPVWRRILVLLAGPFANFLFAIVAYAVLFMAGVPALTPMVGEVMEGSIASEADLRAGDRIVSVGDREVRTREGAVLAILDELMAGEPIELDVVGSNGAARSLELQINGETRALTEPGALMSGLGFDFWYPSVPARVGKVMEDSPAERAGLQPGDLIVAVDGEPIENFQALVQAVQPKPGKVLNFRVARGSEQMTLGIEVEAQQDDGRLVGRIGVQPDTSAEIPDEMQTMERYGPIGSLTRATAKTWDMSALTVRMLWNVVTGNVSVKNLSGPINIAEYAALSARQGILSFLSFLAIVSVSLFVLNLLPIPILDGGQIVYQLAELAKGSPLSDRAQALGQQIGILLLLVLMSFAFYNDLSRFFG
jgi:regulator of sigma E protease